MIKKLLLTTIIMLVINLAIVPSAFASGVSEDAKLADKVKTEITKLGVGKDAQIKVKLKDGTKLKGYVAKINDDNFVVKNTKNGSTAAVSYANAKQVTGQNLPSGVKIAIIVGIAAAVVLLVVYAAGK